MLASLPVAILNHDSRQMGIPHDSKQDDNALDDIKRRYRDGLSLRDEIIGLTIKIKLDYRALEHVPIGLNRRVYI